MHTDDRSPTATRRGVTSLVALLLSVSFQFPLATAVVPVASVAAVVPTTIYVATTGNDANDGTTPETAVQTIAHAIAISSTDGTVMVSDGTYYEHNILIDKPLTILGDPGDAAAGPGTNAPVIDGTGSEYPHDGFKIKNAVNHVTISGFEIQNLATSCDNDGSGVAVEGYENTISDVTISDNSIHDVGYGVLGGNDDDYGLGAHERWAVMRNVVEDFVIGIELTDTSDSTAGDNVIHMTTGTSGCPVGTALWSYVWADQHDLAFIGNTIDGALDPAFTATAFPSGGYPAILVWARNPHAATLTDLVITNNRISVTGTAPRIALMDTATGEIASATIAVNSFTATDPAVSTDPPGRNVNSRPVAARLDATDNWWGAATGPTTGQATGNVDTSHWIGTFTPGTRTPGFWPEDVVLRTSLSDSGGSASIELVDPNGAWHIDFDFTGITGSGSLIVEPTTTLPEDPKGFAALPGAYFFQMSTTGDIAFDHVRICVPYSASLELVPHVFHYHDGWADVTDSTTGEIAANIACGLVHGFSGVIIGLDATPTTLTIDSDAPDPSIIGQAVTVHVTLSSGDVVTDGETVTVSDGTGAGCDVTLSGGVGSCTLTPIGAGAITITATYAGSEDLNLDPTAGTAAHTVLPAGATILYAGDAYLPTAPATVNLKAVVGSGYAPCLDGRAVEFWWDVDGDGVVDAGDVQWGDGTTGPDGVATDSASGVGAGVYELIVRVAATEDCEAALNTGTLVVAGSGDKSNGGGWYTNSGRVSFGYTVQVKTNPKTGVVTVTGQLVWQVNGKYRLKGAVGTYTSGCTPPSPATGTCGYLAGTANLYAWVDPIGWVYVGPVGYRVTVVDGGTSVVCNTGKKKSGSCTTTLKPDWFGMDLPLVTLENEGFAQLKGGNVVVK